MKGVTSSDIREVIGIVNQHILSAGTQIDILKDNRLQQVRTLQKMDSDILAIEKRMDGIKAVNSHLEAEAQSKERKEARGRAQAKHLNATWVDPEDEWRPL